MSVGTHSVMLLNVCRFYVVSDLCEEEKKKENIYFV